MPEIPGAALAAGGAFLASESLGVTDITPIGSGGGGIGGIGPQALAQILNQAGAGGGGQLPAIIRDTSSGVGTAALQTAVQTSGEVTDLRQDVNQIKTTLQRRPDAGGPTGGGFGLPDLPGGGGGGSGGSGNSGGSGGSGDYPSFFQGALGYDAPAPGDWLANQTTSVIGNPENPAETGGVIGFSYDAGDVFGEGARDVAGAASGAYSSAESTVGGALSSAESSAGQLQNTVTDAIFMDGGNGGSSGSSTDGSSDAKTPKRQETEVHLGGVSETNVDPSPAVGGLGSSPASGSAAGLADHMRSQQKEEEEEKDEIRGPTSTPVSGGPRFSP